MRYNPHQQIDGASLASIRIALGLILTWFAYKEVAGGQVLHNYLSPEFHFKYAAFAWLNIPNEVLKLCYPALGFAGMAIATGFLYRPATIVASIAFAVVFLFEGAEYQNHYYFMSVLLATMSLLPANRVWSLDNLWLGRSPRLIPRWSRDVICLLMGLVYFYGGVAKINHDWLLGYPLAIWLDRLPPDHLLFSVAQLPHAAMIASYSGLLLDLLVVPALLWRRTRLAAMAMITLFHCLNSQLFSIGVFPWLSIVLTTAFFAPGWPRLRFARPSMAASPLTPYPVLAFVAAIVLVQVALPLRYHFYEGNPSWTMAGHKFSWRMKLHSRRGFVVFHVVDEHGHVRKVKPDFQLTDRQVQKMAIRPELIRQFAHHLRKKELKERDKDVKVYAQSFVSLNGRPYQRYIDPNVDLSRAKFSDSTYPWILPNRVMNPVLEQRPSLHPSIDPVSLTVAYREALEKSKLR